METIDYSYFIERFISGEMSEAEKTWFKKELEGNVGLQEELEIRKKAEMVLKNNDIIKLRNKLAEIERKRAATVSTRNAGRQFGLKYAAAVAGLLTIGSFIYFNSRNLPKEEIMARYYKPYETVSAPRSLQGETHGDFSIAMEYYIVRDYKNAALYFSKVLTTDPKYIESTMHFGVSKYEEKDYPEAQRLFNTVINDNNNLFIEDARWYLALCYIQTDETDKAVYQLKLIKKSESIYRKNAARVLRRLR